MSGMTKTEQWTKAAGVMKYIAKQFPHSSAAQVDAMAIKRLERDCPTSPWEYPWSEVVRSQRERRRT